eukprot:1180802-Prorocentrum_minimum.AAC.1
MKSSSEPFVGGDSGMHQAYALLGPCGGVSSAEPKIWPAGVRRGSHHRWSLGLLSGPTISCIRQVGEIREREKHKARCGSFDCVVDRKLDKMHQHTEHRLSPHRLRASIEASPGVDGQKGLRLQFNSR